MKNLNEINQLIPEMIKWRRHIHQYPETAFEETKTSNFISDTLKSFGLKIHRGLGGTGIVAILNVGKSNKKIALRADIDALNILEENEFTYKSKTEGKMHACGHDGHTAMLLGAAKYLTESKNFDGTVYFVFQPAEEIKGGGKKMIEDGLFNLFPADSVYAMHNIPDMPAGCFAVKSGPIMASMDNFEIQLLGIGGHAAMPKPGSDLISASANLINNLNIEMEKNFDDAEQVVLSFTNVEAGNSWNVFPEILTLRGTLRCFDTEVRDSIINKHLVKITDDICSSYRIKAKINLNPENPGYPITFNCKKETEIAKNIAIKLVGQENVNLNPKPWTASEDFAFMLNERPGCYIWIGNGLAKNGGVLHNSKYDFNDDILTIGAAFWVNLVENILMKN